MNGEDPEDGPKPVNGLEVQHSLDLHIGSQRIPG